MCDAETKPTQILSELVVLRLNIFFIKLTIYLIKFSLIHISYSTLNVGLKIKK